MKKNTNKKRLMSVIAVVLAWSLAMIVAYAANIGNGGSGTWISGKLTYTYSVATAGNGTSTDGAAGSASVSGNTLTVKATSAKQYSSGGCSPTTYTADSTTTTVRVTNASSYPLKFNSIVTTGSAIVSGVSEGNTIAPGATFTITVTSPANGTNATEKIGTVTVDVENVLPHNVEITFLSPANILGSAPGSYTVSAGNDTYTLNTTHTVSNMTSFTLSASVNSGYVFVGWLVNGIIASTSTTYNASFPEDINIIQPVYDVTGADPLAQIAQLDSDDTSLTKYDFAEYYSYYEPDGYTHVTGTESGSHPSMPNALNYNSYEGIVSSGNGKYIQKDMENVSWSVSGSSITAGRSGTSYGDNSGFSNKDGSVKTNAKVLRIYATQTINVSFDYSVTEWMEKADSSISNGRQIAFFYSLITDSEAPNLTALKAGTSWGGTTASFLEDASHSGHFEETISAGQYLYLWFCGYGYSYTSGGNNGAFGYSFSSTVSNVVIKPEARKFDFQSGAVDGAGNMIGSGAITINNTDYTVGSNGLTSALSDLNGSQNVSLEVKTVPTGYTHIGWRIVDNGTSTDVFESSYSFNIESDSTVYALFSPTITVTAGGTNGFGSATYKYKNPSGTEVTGADQYIARSTDGTAWYKDLGTAFGAQETVVLVTNVALSGSFTVPSGKTLSVPYSLDDVATTDLQRASGSGGISSYVTLTVTDSLTVSGNLVASARQEMSTSGYGRIFGKTGYIRVDGSMSVSGTGKIYAYGMIVGAGTISVASGGYVYELLEIRDMRAIQAMMSAYQNGNAFPFNNFFIKNIEVATTYSSGAYLKAMYYVNVSGITADGELPVIGKDTDSRGMFKIAGGSLTKAFSAASAYNNKIIFRAENGSDIQTGSFAISMTATIAGISKDVNVDTRNYVLPLGYGYAIEVENGGSFTINDNYKLLPGARVDVKEGGTVTIASDKKLVLYRANDYDFRSYGSSAAQGFSSSGYPTAFTKPTDLSYATNNASNVGSAKLNVDGTLIVNGGLYVTNQPTENTTYSNGYNYLTGTGEIRISINSGLTNGLIYEEKQKGSDETQSVTVAYVPIKGITVWNATTDNGQDNYNSFTKTNWYGWKNDNNVNVWTTTRPVALSYDANGGTGTAPATSRKPSSESFTAAAANTFTRTGFTFTGWNTKADGSGMSYTAGATISPSENVTLYAQWALNTYTVTWKNMDGSDIDTTTVNYGVRPTHDDPTKESNAEHCYTFAGWASSANQTSGTATASLPTVTGNVTYFAAFRETSHSYEISTFDGTCTEPGSTTYTCSNCGYSYSESIPALGHSWGSWTTTKAATCEETGIKKHTCTSCDIEETETIPALGHNWGEPVWTWTGSDAEGYTAAKATFTCTRDGSHKHEETATIENNKLVHSQTAQYDTYTATVAFIGTHTDTKNVLRSYAITFVNWDDTVLQSSEFKYGQMPVYSGETPTKEATALFTYTFSGWNPKISEVTGTATYTATYTESVSGYPFDIYFKKSDVSDTALSYSTIYRYGDSVQAAAYRYYDFVGWSLGINNSNVPEYDASETSKFLSALYDYLSDPNNSSPAVTAHYTRQTYTFTMCTKIEEGSIDNVTGFVNQNRVVGKSLGITAPATFGSDNTPFAYWEVIITPRTGFGDTFTVTYDSTRATFMPTVPGTYQAIAHFEANHTQKPVSIRIANTFSEIVENNEKVGITLELSSLDQDYQIKDVGFLFTTDQKKLDDPLKKFSFVNNKEIVRSLAESGNGSYTKRYTVDDNPTTVEYDTYYVIGFVTYEDANHNEYTLYCVKNHPSLTAADFSELAIQYDTLSYTSQYA